MILLIGGTSETAPLGLALAEAGFKVLVSTATDVLLDVGIHPNLSRRTGILDHAGMLQVAAEQGIKLIVDASHPYAASVRARARETATDLNIPYLNWVRPSVLEKSERVIFRDNHDLAAQTACSFGAPVLLTTGSRNLVPYVAEAVRNKVDLVVRVLDHPDSLAACRRSGVQNAWIVAGRGPYSLDQNLEVLTKFNIGVLVTKDSGVAGGVPEKLEAARIHNCRVVVVRRPIEFTDKSFSNVKELVAAIMAMDL
jgi:precorrin-6A/cobalt-precorrin-6A reductase